MLLLKQNAEYEIKIMGEERMIILNKQTIMLELINKAINYLLVCTFIYISNL